MKIINIGVLILLFLGTDALSRSANHDQQSQKSQEQLSALAKRFNVPFSYVEENVGLLGLAFQDLAHDLIYSSYRPVTAEDQSELNRLKTSIQEIQKRCNGLVEVDQTAHKRSLSKKTRSCLAQWEHDLYAYAAKASQSPRAQLDFDILVQAARLLLGRSYETMGWPAFGSTLEDYQEQKTKLPEREEASLRKTLGDNQTTCA